MCVCVTADSHCCTRETNSTMQINRTPIKKNFLITIISKQKYMK